MRSQLLLFVISLAGYGAAVTIPAATFHLDWSRVSPAAPKVHDDHHNAATTEAMSQLQCMLNTVYYAITPNAPGDTGGKEHKKALAMIHEVFGKDANVAKIKTMTDTLAGGALVIAADNYPNGPANSGSFAITDGFKQHPGVVYIMALYHTAQYRGRAITEVQRARVLIHEASHALFETWDNWAMKVVGGQTHIMPVTGQMATDHYAALKKRAAGGVLTDVEKSHIHDPMIAGYWHEGYSVLRDLMSSSMHSNADSWAVFGYRCRKGQMPHPRLVTQNAAEIASIVW